MVVKRLARELVRRQERTGLSARIGTHRGGSTPRPLPDSDAGAGGAGRKDFAWSGRELTGVDVVEAHMNVLGREETVAVAEVLTSARKGGEAGLVFHGEVGRSVTFRLVLGVVKEVTAGAGGVGGGRFSIAPGRLLLGAEGAYVGRGVGTKVGRGCAIVV